ncbi:MAG: helical backbone metal receptor [Lachnospiraceae bacterium]|nr:helical backbone metal receptor [Lachnospiraceae bacterium]
MRRKILTIAMAACVSLSMLAGCGKTKTDTEVSSAVSAGDVEEAVSAGDVEEAVSAGDSEEADILDKDRAGNDITVPENVSAIISMSPSVTEVLIDLGCADKVVACDTYSGTSPFATALTEDIPQFDMMTPDSESIIALNPDVVITTGMSYAGGEDVYAAVRDAGICVADIPSSASVEDIKKDIAFIGALVGADSDAQELISKMEETEKVLAEKSAEIADKKKVLYVMSVPTADYPDVYTCGKGTYMDEVFAMAGCINIAGDIDYQWPAMSEEDIIAADPDVIIVGDTYTENPVDAIMNIAQWKDITAIKNCAVYTIDGDAFNQPDHYVMNSACDIAKSVYPEEFEDLENPFN